MSVDLPIWLSHQFAIDTPGYRGAATLEVEAVSSTERGDTANSARWAFPNHSGTHIDCPAHFYGGARTVTDFPASWWVFEHPHIIDVRVEADVLIGPTHLLDAVPTGTDMLLLRTGFEAVRSSDRYWQANPGLSPDLADWLRDEHPNVRVVGMDFLSVTAFAHRTTGRAAHRAFLDPDAPMLLIEDMALAAAPEKLARVVVLPLRVTDADGSPCTIIGFPTSGAA